MYISIYTIRYVQYVQSRLCEEDYALSYLTYAMTTASHVNGGMLCLRSEDAFVIT
jgi:hypothetical protein